MFCPLNPHGFFGPLVHFQKDDDSWEAQENLWAGHTKAILLVSTPLFHPTVPWMSKDKGQVHMEDTHSSMLLHPSHERKGHIENKNKSLKRIPTSFAFPSKHLYLWHLDSIAYLWWIYSWTSHNNYYKDGHINDGGSMRSPSDVIASYLMQISSDTFTNNKITSRRSCQNVSLSLHATRLCVVFDLHKSSSQSPGIRTI